MANNLKYTLLVIDKFTAPIQNAVKSVNKLSRATEKFSSKAQKSLSKVHNTFAKFDKKIGKVGRGLSLKLSAPLGVIGYKAIKGAGQFERYERVLTTMLGSTEKAKVRLKELEDIAIFTPFELHQVVDLGNQLQALGKYSKENIMLLGDLAAASGKPIEQVSRAYAKLVSGQKGIAVDMFRDLLITTDDWVEATGKGVRKSGEMMASTKDMIKVLPDILRKKNFLGMMESQAEGLEGVMSNLADATSKSFRQLGKAFVVATDLKNKVKGLIEFIDNLTNKFNALSPAMKKIISYIGILLFVLSPVLITIGKIGMGLFFFGKTIMFLIPLMGTLLGVFKAISFFLVANPIGVALLIAIGVFKLFGGSFTKLAKDIMTVLGWLTEKFMAFGKFFVKYIFSKIERGIKIFKKAQEVVNKVKFWKKDEDVNINQNMSIDKTLQNRNSMNGEIMVNFANAPKGTQTSTNFQTNSNMNFGTNMSFGGY